MRHQSIHQIPDATDLIQSAKPLTRSCEAEKGTSDEHDRIAVRTSVRFLCV